MYPYFVEIVTLNPEMLTHNVYHDALRSYMVSDTICVADGRGLIQAAHWINRLKLQQVTGIDLCMYLLTQSSYRLYFVGASPAVMDRLVALFSGKCQIVGFHHGYFSEKEEVSLLEDIGETKPDIILVGLGYPRQTHFIQKCKAVLDSGIGIGVGGSFDVLSGAKNRAPRIFQRVGLEWFYRGISEPSRLGRWRFIPRFLRMVYKEIYR